MCYNVELLLTSSLRNLEHLHIPEFSEHFLSQRSPQCELFLKFTLVYGNSFFQHSHKTFVLKYTSLECTFHSLYFRASCVSFSTPQTLCKKKFDLRAIKKVFFLGKERINIENSNYGQYSWGLIFFNVFCLVNINSLFGQCTWRKRIAPIRAEYFWRIIMNSRT